MKKILKMSILLSTLATVAVSADQKREETFKARHITKEYRDIIGQGNYIIISKAKPHTAYHNIESIKKPAGGTNIERTRSFLSEYTIISSKTQQENPIFKFVEINGGKLGLKQAYKTKDKKEALQYSFLKRFSQALPNPKYLESWTSVLANVVNGDTKNLTYNGQEIELDYAAFEQEEKKQEDIVPLDMVETHEIKLGNITAKNVPTKFDDLIKMIEADDVEDNIILEYDNGDVKLAKTVKEVLTALNKKNDIKEEELKAVFENQG